MYFFCLIPVKKHLPNFLIPENPLRNLPQMTQSSQRIHITVTKTLHHHQNYCLHHLRPSHSQSIQELKIFSPANPLYLSLPDLETTRWPLLRQEPNVNLVRGMPCGPTLSRRAQKDWLFFGGEAGGDSVHIIQIINQDVD